MGSVNNIASTCINCSSDHHDVQDVHVNSFSSDFCDIDTHPDVVALPNVESMVETIEVLEEQEGVDQVTRTPNPTFGKIGESSTFSLITQRACTCLPSCLTILVFLKITGTWMVLGVNTYTLINKAGKAHYVKFHWRPTAGSNHDHATQDLYDSIAAGNYPEWKLFIQIIDLDHEDKFDFDPLDVTKTWPEDILPLMCHYGVVAICALEGKGGGGGSCVGGPGSTTSFPIAEFQIRRFKLGKVK
ncbi:hypothetical protein Sjap_017508 [Stephania japonica]|uniref:catalase n=1 Tax=Stephania japonica TaxID=461633 RepID=A0AAP0NJI3_9MAGN